VLRAKRLFVHRMPIPSLPRRNQRDTVSGSMTCAVTTDDLSPLGSWLPTLDAETALRMLGLPEGRNGHEVARLVDTPIALREQLVHGRLRSDGGSEERASVGLARSGDLACLCSCHGFAQAPPCEHVTGLLLELAGSPALRTRLVDQSNAARDAATGDVPPPDLPRALALARRHGLDLEAARAASPRRTGLLDTTFAAWRRRGTVRPLGAAAFMVGVERGDDEDDVTAPPGLRVKIRIPGERTSFGPDDLEGRRLPAHEWRLFEPLARAPGGAREFVARGEKAAVFLERVAEAGAVLHDESGTDTLAVLTQPVRPALQLRAATDADVRANSLLQMRAAEVEEEQLKLRLAWLEYNADGRALDERGFRTLLGLSPDGASASGRDGAYLLEAVWRPTRAGGAIAAEGAPVPFDATILLRGATSWVYFAEARCFARVASDVGPIALARLAAHPQVLVERDELPRLPALMLEHFQSEGIALPSRDDLGLPPLPLPRTVLRVSGSTFHVEATLEAAYGETRFVLTPRSCATVEQHDRNAELERAALDVLGGTVLSLAAARRRPGRRSASAEQDTDTYRASGDDAVFFWTRDLPRLVADAAVGGALSEVVVPPALRNVTARAPLAATLAAEVAPRSTITVDLRYAADGIPADVEEIRQALAAKRRWVKLTDGSVAELSQRVANLATATHDTLGDAPSAELPRHVLGEVAAWSELAEHVELDSRLADWTQRLRELSASATPAPVAGLVGDLRSYQKIGLAWLQFLSELGAGGILADDMGLGKTIQTLAVVAWRRERDGAMPSLVVAPTSVAPNWIREAERFVPGLKCILLHGLGRHAHYEDVPQADLVVTTYALLRRDVERLRDIRFRYVILDEAQQIKNHAAATTAAAKSLPAEARLALTGTPIENRLLELWSILDFVNPGMLGSWRSFSRRYERPVVAALAEAPPSDDPDALVDPAEVLEAAQQAAVDEAAALRARIRPFVMRRTKADVESDLPPKIETDVIVDLTPAQHRAYAALVTATREDLARRLAADGFERNRMVVLTALLRLRQMACDPRLVDRRFRAQDSAKLEAFRELTAEVIASGRRALVFSQFVELLTLLRADLDQRGIAYSYLDGRTRDRSAVLQGFAEGTMPLFLLSLRAGGTGINLTAADVVIHLDPWWNPAVEEQATDRAHRIGQKKMVSVYRIIAAGTIEEAILRLKRQKRALASTVIDDDRGWLKQLTETDITELLSLP